MQAGQIKFDFDFAKGISDGVAEDARKAREILESRQGKGNDFLGWMDLPAKIGDDHLSDVEATAEQIRKSEGLVSVGIGGSYLGARAVIEALSDPFEAVLPVYYAGHNLDAAYHKSLMKHLAGKRYSVNVISKSGTTTEPGIAFRMLWNDLKSRFSQEEIRKLVYATTDSSKGSLRKLSDHEGLKTFVIPDDVGGRYSVLTPVGLLPIAAAGLDIRSFVRGAKTMMEHLKNASTVEENQAMAYAAYRNGAYRKGRKIEIMASYIPSLHYVSEWWKQLFGESEGKENRGIFPASVDLTTDLHSMGQWIQEGERSIFQTVIDIVKGDVLEIPGQETDDDNLNYLAGRNLHDVNRTALKATREAHASGDVPIARLELPELNEEVLGALMYMFEYACGVSAYMLEVNPFDQPGVEAYKKNMFRMLGKPGN